MTGSEGRAARLAMSVASLAIACAALAPRSAIGADHSVTIEAMQFSPATLSVRAGDTVTWVNRDPFPHTVASPQAGFASPEIAAGKTWRVQLGSPGSFEYRCTLHPTMKARLRVEAK